MTKVEVISETTKSDKEWRQGDLLVSSANGNIVCFERYGQHSQEIFEGTYIHDEDFEFGYSSRVFDSAKFTRWYGRIIIDSVREA